MGDRPRELKVVTGSAAIPCSGRIAFSLVHPVHRIDVPVRAVLEVEACGEQTFRLPDRSSKTYDIPHVRIALAPDIGARLYRLTDALMRFDSDRDRTLEIIVKGECVSRTVVREALGPQSGFSILAYDLGEAEALAVKLRVGFVRTPLRLLEG